MSPTFLNTNTHDAYVVDPERQDERTSGASGLLRVRRLSEFSATGRLAEEADKVPGIVRADSAEGKEFSKRGGTLDQRNALINPPGPATFPVPEDERTAERSGLHITGRDSGVPVAADVEPGDTKDGTGEDKFRGIAAVEGGEVTRGDVPLAVKEEPSVEEPGNLSELSDKKLRKIAAERDVQGRSKMNKEQLIAALEAPRADGGGGGVAVQTEDASKTEKSEAVAESGGTITTDDDPTAGREPKRPRARSKKSGSRKRRSTARRKR